eukprot:g5531.t1
MTAIVSQDCATALTLRDRETRGRLWFKSSGAGELQAATEFTYAQFRDRDDAELDAAALDDLAVLLLDVPRSMPNSMTQETLRRFMEDVEGKKEEAVMDDGRGEAKEGDHAAAGSESLSGASGESAVAAAAADAAVAETAATASAAAIDDTDAADDGSVATDSAATTGLGDQPAGGDDKDDESKGGAGGANSDTLPAAAAAAAAAATDPSSPPGKEAPHNPSAMLERKLTDVLRAYLHFMPRPGYVQGMAMMVVQLLVFCDEDAAFWMFCNLIRHVCPRGLFDADMKAYMAEEATICRLAEEAFGDLSGRMAAVGDFSLDECLRAVVPRFMNTLFVDTLPVAITIEIWDCLFSDPRFALESGTAVPLCALLALLELFEDELATTEDGISFLTGEDLSLGLEQIALADFRRAIDRALRRFPRGKLDQVRAEERAKVDPAVAPRKKGLLHYLRSLRWRPRRRGSRSSSGKKKKEEEDAGKQGDAGGNGDQKGRSNAAAGDGGVAAAGEGEGEEGKGASGDAEEPVDKPRVLLRNIVSLEHHFQVAQTFVEQQEKILARGLWGFADAAAATPDDDESTTASDAAAGGAAKDDEDGAEAGQAEEKGQQDAPAVFSDSESDGNDGDEDWEVLNSSGEGKEQPEQQSSKEKEKGDTFAPLVLRRIDDEKLETLVEARRKKHVTRRRFSLRKRPDLAAEEAVLLEQLGALPKEDHGIEQFASKGAVQRMASVLEGLAGLLAEVVPGYLKEFAPAISIVYWFPRSVCFGKVDDEPANNGESQPASEKTAKALEQQTGSKFGAGFWMLDDDEEDGNEDADETDATTEDSGFGGSGAGAAAAGALHEEEYKGEDGGDQNDDGGDCKSGDDESSEDGEEILDVSGPPAILDSYEVVLERIYEYGAFLAQLKVREEGRGVLAAVKQDWRALEVADSKYKKDPKVVLAAVTHFGCALQFADEELKKDPKVVLAAVKQNGHALQYADPKLKKDPVIVLAAVKQHGHALEYADPEWKKDREIVLAAVKQRGTALRYADPELMKDREIVLAAVKQNGHALQYADPELKKDREFVLAAVKQDGRALKYADPELKKDREIVLAAVKQKGWALQYADPELK